MERAAAGEIKGRNQRSVQFVPGVDLAERPSHREILEQHLVDVVAVPFLLGARMRFEVPLPNHQWLGIVRANNDSRTQPSPHTTCNYFLTLTLTGPFEDGRQFTNRA